MQMESLRTPRSMALLGEFPRDPQRGEIQRLTSSEVADLTPVNAAAAHQDQGLRTKQALNRNRSAIRAGGEHSIMAFRPSTQQTGLNLFKIEKGSPMANGLALAERIAKQLPLTDPPRQGLQQMEALLVRRLTEAEKVSRDWKRINSQLSVIQNFNKFYSGQVRKYESEIWPSTHPVVLDLVKKRMRDGHVALTHTAAEAAKVLAVRGQLLQHSVGYEPTQTLRFQEEYDVGIKKLLKLLEVEPEPGASLYDRIDSIPSPPYSPVHLTVEELEELEVEQVTTQRPTKQPRMGSTANILSSNTYRDTSSFDMGTDGMDFSQEHPEVLGGSPGVSMGRGVTVVMGETRTKDLTTFSVAALDAFQNQCRQARKNSTIFNRSQYIPQDSTVRNQINSVLRTQGHITEQQSNCWDAWDDDRFFTTLRPILQSREATTAIPDPHVQFGNEVKLMVLNLQKPFDELTLEMDFYRAARRHNLMLLIEQPNTFTKAKRKEFQTALHSGFKERGKGETWRLHGVHELMSQSNTGDMTMREWFDYLYKQVTQVDSSRFLVDIAMKTSSTKETSNPKSGRDFTKDSTKESNKKYKTEGAPGTKDKDKGKGNDSTKEKDAGKVNSWCYGCGRSNHLVGECVFAKTVSRHPDLNTTSQYWRDSDAGVRWPKCTSNPPGSSRFLSYNYHSISHNPQITQHHISK